MRISLTNGQWTNYMHTSTDYSVAVFTCFLLWPFVQSCKHWAHWRDTHMTDAYTHHHNHHMDNSWFRFCLFLRYYIIRSAHHTSNAAAVALSNGIEPWKLQKNTRINVLVLLLMYWPMRIAAIKLCHSIVYIGLDICVWSLVFVNWLRWHRLYVLWMSFGCLVSLCANARVSFSTTTWFLYLPSYVSLLSSTRAADERNQ